jgi:hypothetical protein
LTGGLATIDYVTATASIPAAPDSTSVSIGSAEAVCPGGTHVIGGGVNGGGGEIFDIDAFPSDGTGNGVKGTVAYFADVYNEDTSGAESVAVYAICAASTTINTTGF